MVLDPNQLHKISYFMDHEVPHLGLVSEYHVYMSDRLVTRVAVQIEDEQKIGGDEHETCYPIWVMDYLGKNATRLDEGHAHMKWDEKRGKNRISADSVKYVVSALIPWILVTLYVPEN